MQSLASIPKSEVDPNEQTQRKKYKNVKLLPKTNNKKRETKNHGSELTRFRFLGSAMNKNLISTCIFKFSGKNGTYIFQKKNKKLMKFLQD